VYLSEWQEVKPTRENGLLNVFIENSWRSVGDQLSQSGKIRFRELKDGLSIEASSYVGRIVLGDLQITIKPKLNQLPLMNLLRYAFDLRLLEVFPRLEHEAETCTFQDLLILQLEAEARELLSRGLHKKYVEKNECLTIPKGRIDFNACVRLKGHEQAQLPCRYFLRIEDNLFNQTVLSGLYIASQVTSDQHLRAQLRRLAKVFEDRVSRVGIGSSVFQNLKNQSNRLTSSYTPAITIIEMLVDSTGLSLDGAPPRVKTPGFLFDMNRFFQSLLSKFLRENVSEYVIQEEHRLRGMLSYHPDHNPLRKRPPTLRPDFIALDGKRVIAILDAKYRDLWELGLPPNMLYQLSIYALSQLPVSQAVILYPTTSARAMDSVIEISDPVHQVKRARVILRPVDMTYLAKLISNLRSSSCRRERAKYAHSLISTVD